MPQVANPTIGIHPKAKPETTKTLPVAVSRHTKASGLLNCWDWGTIIAPKPSIQHQTADRARRKSVLNTNSTLASAECKQVVRSGLGRVYEA